MMSNWYGNFSGPIDADGREVPLDTKVMYDANGKKLTITSFTFSCDAQNSRWAYWKVFSPDAKCDDGMFYVESLYLTAPDSWEKLENDLCSMLRESCACRYFGHDTSIDCDECPADDRSVEGPCINEVARDILRRAKELSESDVND